MSDDSKKAAREQYQTPHPMELVVCAGEEEIELANPYGSTFEDRAIQLLEMPKFQRIWVVKLTPKIDSIWFVHPQP